MLRIAICDDSQLWLQKIETLTRGYLKKINVKYRLDLYQSGEKLLKSITSPYDIALLDVDLHSTNGIEVASQLRATNPQIVLIFVSEYVGMLRSVMRWTRFGICSKTTWSRLLTG